MISFLGFCELGQKWLRTHELSDGEVRDILDYLSIKRRAVTMLEGVIAEHEAEGLPARFQRKIIRWDEGIIEVIVKFLKEKIEYDRNNDR